MSRYHTILEFLVGATMIGMIGAAIILLIKAANMISVAINLPYTG